MAYFQNIPVIGSGPAAFSDIGQQLGYWDRRNVGVQSDNIARANAAQNQRNNYFAQLAAQRQQAMERDMQTQLQMDAANRQQAADRANLDRQYAFAEKSNQFKADAQSAKNKLEQERTDAMLTIPRMQQEFKRQAALDKIDQIGSNFASNYGGYQQDLQSAQEAVAKLEKEKADLVGRQQALNAKQAAAGWLSGGPHLSSEEKKELLSLDGKIKDIEKQLAPNAPAQRVLLMAQKKLSDQQVRIQNSGFLLDPANNHIVHGPTGKRWSFRQDDPSGDSTLTEEEASYFDGLPDETTDSATDNSAPVVQALPQAPGTTTGNYFAPTNSAPPVTITKTWVRGPDGKLVLAQ